MTLHWIRETPAVWDADKKRIIGEAEVGIFDHRFRQLEVGDPVASEWWRVKQDGETVGFGWLDVVWGDAEILFATDPAARGQGVATFVLEHLLNEAKQQRLNYVYNTVRPTHPHKEEFTNWLRERGFQPCADGSLRRSCN